MDDDSYTETCIVFAGTRGYRMAISGWDKRPYGYDVPATITVTGIVDEDSNSFEWVEGNYQYTVLFSEVQPT